VGGRVRSIGRAAFQPGGSAVPGVTITKSGPHSSNRSRFQRRSHTPSISSIRQDVPAEEPVKRRTDDAVDASPWASGPVTVMATTIGRSPSASAARRAARHRAAAVRMHRQHPHAEAAAAPTRRRPCSECRET
jgi:hypothetical protein